MYLIRRAPRVALRRAISTQWQACTRRLSGTATLLSSGSGDDGGSEKDKKWRRSHAWFGKADRDGYIHRSWMRNQGLPDEAFDGRPVIGICSTWSELTPCNAHLRDVADRVKRGVWEAGGLPLEFPVLSTGESLLRPTAMLLRNLMAMDTEECLRGYPIDGTVLLTGCDKTTPGTLMGAASTDLPTLLLTGGPMLNGRWRGRKLGSGTDVWKLSEQVRGGQLSLKDFMDAEAGNSRSTGHCNTMGTASSMACVAEALGMSLPGSAAIPAADSRRNTLAHLAGRRAVEMVRDDLRPSQVLTKGAFENAIAALAAVGGSTNAVVHLLALARRVGVSLSLDDFDRVGRQVPLLANLQPAGEHLMEEFFYAGGLPAVLRRIHEAGALPDPEALTVSGQRMGESVAYADCYDDDVIRPASDPLLGSGRAGITVLKGNLAPNGAIIKPAAASPSLMKHRGRAVVFSSKEDFEARISDEELDVDETSVLVLQGAGPVGYPGMPEVGNMALPPKLLRKGITDMVRISDGRMSGTAYGTVVLHVSPESAVGGPLALVRDGDTISLDVEAGKLELEVEEEELARRKQAWKAPAPVASRGYSRMYVDNVTQSHEGCDLGFLHGASGHDVPRESH